MYDILKIIFVIIGSIIGAGFISGQEIYTFFLKYGEIGFVCVFFMGILLGAVIYKICLIMMNEKTMNYDKFLNIIFKSKFSKMKKFLHCLVNIFLLISFFIMCAAFCAYFKQEYNISVYLSGIILSIICYIVFIKNINTIIKINSILMPIIIILIFFLITKLDINQVNINSSNNILIAILNCILYVSYNIIILIPILLKLKGYMKSKKNIFLSSLICSIIVVFMALIIMCTISQINRINFIEIPLLYITDTYGLSYKYIYSLVLIIAIVTSAISAGYGFLENTIKNKRNYKKLAFLICIISIFVSNLGFSNLVNVLYPLFGVLGFLQIFFILKY